METRAFSFDLPEELIAQHPTRERGKSRLMVADRETGLLVDTMVSSLHEHLEPGTVMVLNDSRVRKARIYATPVGGSAPVEFLLVRPLTFAPGPDAGARHGKEEENETGPPIATEWLATVNKAKRQRPGRRYTFPEGVEGEIVGSDERYRRVRFYGTVDEAYLERNGHVPLPPYIRREDTPADVDRYQTVYARRTGSVAAPTAGLHFTERILGALRGRGVEIYEITLHVGLGTFLPVTSETVEEHRMHSEEFTISDETAAAVERAKREGRPVLAVGTTSLRSLEAAWVPGEERLRRGDQETDIFIYPGYTFQVVDQLFTNFHTPQSTLLMLVSAFAGRERLLSWYEHAVRERYRFFSYGDAMLMK
ncbi:MAG: tRNA preQ1(34) S-adenosylmethionine ribosyltransferase-isomerase QueA [Spirochaetaceae bacterium]